MSKQIGRAVTSEQKGIRRAVEVLARLDPERTPEQHQQYVENVVAAISPYLVLRSLYDGVVRELHRERGVPE